MRPFGKDDPGPLKNSQQSQFRMVLLRMNLETVSIVFIKLYEQQKQILKESKFSLDSMSTQTKLLYMDTRWIKMNLGQFFPLCAFSSKIIF